MNSSQVSHKFNVCLVGRIQPEQLDRFHIQSLPYPQQGGSMKFYDRDSRSSPGPGPKVTTFCLHDSPSMDVSMDVQVMAGIDSLAYGCIFLVFLQIWLLQSRSQRKLLSLSVSSA